MLLNLWTIENSNFYPTASFFSKKFKSVKVRMAMCCFSAIMKVRDPGNFSNTQRDVHADSAGVMLKNEIFA